MSLDLIVTNSDLPIGRPWQQKLNADLAAILASPNNATSSRERQGEIVKCFAIFDFDERSGLRNVVDQAALRRSLIIDRDRGVDLDAITTRASALTRRKYSLEPAHFVLPTYDPHHSTA
jgi:hypothetical protein